MGTFWNEEKIALYEEAAKFLNYPEVPLQKFFKELIRPDDTVMEIGSGPGIVSLYLAPLCKRLIAIDDCKTGCDHLQMTAAERGISNIEVKNMEWPGEGLEPADVTVSLYVYKVFKTMDRVQELLRQTRRAGIMMIAQPGLKGGFPWDLYEKLGIDPDSLNCYNDGCRTAALLEAAGAKVRCERIHHDFGQPVNNLDEAAHFLSRQLKVRGEYFPALREVVEELVETREGRLYIPHKRTNCVIVFEK